MIKYLPFGIKFFLFQKQWTLSLRKYGNLQAKQRLFLFQSSCQCFISVWRNIDFLNQLRSCYSSFNFKSNQLHMIIGYFLGINWSSVSSVFVVEKITPTESIGKLLFIAPVAICHHLKILLSIPPVNDSLSIFKNMPVLFTFIKNIQHQKYCCWYNLWNSRRWRGWTISLKNSWSSHDCRIGEYCFSEAVKVDLAESEDKQQKNQPQRNKNQLSSTVALLHTLFEDIVCAIECLNAFLTNYTST